MNLKRFVLLALLAVMIGGTAYAQQDMGNSDTVGATYITGVLQSIDKSGLTLRDDGGQQVTFLIVPGTVGAKNLTLGTRIRVNFHRDANDVSIADTIQGARGNAETVAVAAAPVQSPPTYTESTPTPEPTAKLAVTTPEPEYVKAEVTHSEPSLAASLPHTASPLAAIGLLGLISLGGALAIRFGN